MTFYLFRPIYFFPDNDEVFATQAASYLSWPYLMGEGVTCYHIKQKLHFLYHLKRSVTLQVLEKAFAVCSRGSAADQAGELMTLPRPLI